MPAVKRKADQSVTPNVSPIAAHHPGNGADNARGVEIRKAVVVSW